MVKQFIIQKIFDDFIKIGQHEMTESLGELLYIRFNYTEKGQKELFDRNYLGSDLRSLSNYEDGTYNGSANYIPLLIIEDKEKTINYLTELVNTIFKKYRFNELIEKYGEIAVIKRIIISLFSNATYYDYENVLPFFERNINFYKDKNVNLFNNDIISNYIDVLDGKIAINNCFDSFGYEAPLRFDTMIFNEENNYYLPTINYGISNDICYIYSVQNKNENDTNNYTKNIKRKLNKINANIICDNELDLKDTILGTTPSFILSLTIFFKYLQSIGINNIEFITFLPDRYFEKKYTEYDMDSIQRNITEKNILSFYRLQYHFPSININYPIYDGYAIDGKNHGNNLLIDISNMKNLSNNEFLNDIINNLTMNIKQKTL